MFSSIVAYRDARQNSQYVERIKNYIEEKIGKAVRDGQLEIEMYFEMSKSESQEILDWLIGYKYLVIIQSNNGSVYNYIISWAKPLLDGKIVFL